MIKKNNMAFSYYSEDLKWSIKITTDEEFKLIQDVLFSLGYYWYSSVNNRDINENKYMTKLYNNEIIFVVKEGYMYRSSSRQVDVISLTFDKFIEMAYNEDIRNTVPIIPQSGI